MITRTSIRKEIRLPLPAHYTIFLYLNVRSDSWAVHGKDIYRMAASGSLIVYHTSEIWTHGVDGLEKIHRKKFVAAPARAFSPPSRESVAGRVEWITSNFIVLSRFVYPTLE